LGLAVVHSIVKNYGGEITVESEVGKGTVFTVYLPITEKADEKESYKPEPLPRGMERVLLVDDELSIATMGAQMLTRLGYQVTIQTDSLKALELFRSNPNAFDVVISDITMPHMFGDKLAVEILKIRDNIAIILCTGYSKRISKEQIAQYGVKALVLKPISRNNIARTIRKVLDESRK
jgi:CheY-like chemotaxis protein